MINNKELKILTKKIFIIALPMIVQGFVFQIQSITDKIFLGNLETKYLSAVGASHFPFGATLDTLFALCIGITVIISQLFNNDKNEKIISVAKSTVFFNSILSWIMFLVWFFLGEQILKVLSVDECIMQYCVKYVQIWSFYFLLTGFDASIQGMLTGMQKTKPIMYAGIIKVVANIALDWILIFGKFGIKPQYLEGAAIATMSSDVLSALYIISCGIRQFCRMEHKHFVHIFDFKFSLYKQVIKIGIPAGMEMFLWNASNLIMVKFLNSISYLATTIYTLTFAVEVLIYNIFSNIGKAGMTLEGNYLGRDDKDTAKKIVCICQIYSLLVIFLAMAIFFIFPEQIIGLFTKRTDVIKSAAPYLCFTAFIMIPKSINTVVGNGIRAYGNTKWMLYTQIVGSIFVVSCSFILIQLIHMNVLGIYITILLDESIRAILNFFHYFKGSHKNMVKI